MIKKRNKEELQKALVNLQKDLETTTQSLEVCAALESKLANEQLKVTKTAAAYNSKAEGFDREGSPYRNAILSGIGRQPSSLQGHIKTVSAYRQRAISLTPAVRKLNSRASKATVQYKKANLKTHKLKNRIASITKTMKYFSMLLEKEQQTEAQ